MSLQVFSKTDLIFFAIGCLLTIAAFLYIEHRRKSIRFVYPIICLQNQGFIWFALRLESDQSFYEDFEESTSAEKILHIWNMQLFNIICASFVHFLLKWLQKVISNHQFDENSTLVITFYYITDRDILKKLLIDYITKTKKDLNKIRTKNRLELISNLLRQIMWLVVYLTGIFLTACFFGVVGFIAYILYQTFNAIPSTDAARYLLLPLASVYAISLIAIPGAVTWLTVDYIAKLFKNVIYFIIFLIVFIAYYGGISIALYFLESILSFDEVNAYYVLLNFVFFSFSCIKMIIFIL